MTTESIPRIVIIGAGFGGINAARAVAKADVQVTIIDRNNYHTFQPLLYQIATAGLSPGEIAEPVRSIFRNNKNIEVLMDEVTGFDLGRKVILTNDAEIPYDYLIVATGASHAYFGHDDWAPFAPGLKSIEDGLEIRRRVLLAFELAERESHSKGVEAARQLNFVVVGGGPTGAELAGTLAEIARHALNHEFRSIDPAHTHVMLIEGGPRILPSYAEDLSRSAQQQLEHLGVEVRTSAMVTHIEAGAVYLGNTKLPATVIIWAAGVAASPLGKKLGAPVDRAGRVEVQPDLSLPAHPEVFVIGDLASVKDEHGKMLPGVAPVAIQQGQYVAKLIRQEIKKGYAETAGAPSKPAFGLSGDVDSASQKNASAPLLADVSRKGNFDSTNKNDGNASSRNAALSPTSPSARPVFHYWDKGSLATIGRAAAIAEFGKIHISGFLAWLSWLFIHIFFLIGFQNRILVLIQWGWSYITYERGARLITGSTSLPGWTTNAPSKSTLDSSLQETHPSAK
jgi:NADH:ubiquinone reductase (H+-translocating)